MGPVVAYHCRVGVVGKHVPYGLSKLAVALNGKDPGSRASAAQHPCQAHATPRARLANYPARSTAGQDLQETTLFWSA